MVSLLDVNVLLALAWPNHQHHRLAEDWFLSHARGGWATCCLTELGFVRLSSNPAYSRDAVSPADAIELLAELREAGKHHFWKAMPSALALDGRALMALLGCPPGPHVGEGLRALLDLALDEPERNTAAGLAGPARAWWASRGARMAAGPG